MLPKPQTDKTVEEPDNTKIPKLGTFMGSFDSPPKKDKEKKNKCLQKLDIQDCDSSDIAKLDDDFDDGIDDELFMTCTNTHMNPGENGNIDEITSPEQKGSAKE